MAEQEDQSRGCRLPHPQEGRASRDHCMEMAAVCADFNLRRANRLVSQTFDRALRPLGLKITQLSLLVAARLNENIVLHRLARFMGMDRTTLSRNLAILEKKGLITLEKGEDRRQVLVRLTPAGLQAMEKAGPVWQRTQQRITQSLGDEAWLELVGQLRTLVKHLK